MIFAGKTFWLTGASSGIGEAVAVELSKHKVRLILSGRNTESLDKVKNICQNNGSTVRLEPFELTDTQTLETIAKKVIADGEKIYGLYHFGGISQRSFVAETPINIDREIMEVNFFSTVALTKIILPTMIKNGGGQIALTSSVVGKFGIPYRSAYSASKHALHGFYESLRAEYTNKNIKVTFFIPGRIVTNISLNALTKNGDKYNIMDAGQASGMSAQKAAKIILRALKKQRNEVIFGGKETLMVHIRRWCPCLYYYLSSRVKPL